MTKIELKLWNNWEQRKGRCRNVFTLLHAAAEKQKSGYK